MNKLWYWLLRKKKGTVTVKATVPATKLSSTVLNQMQREMLGKLM